MIVQKSFDLKLAGTDTAADRGVFRGTALVYNERDAMGDVIREGCFTKSIADAGGRFPCLWTHDASQPIGNISVESDNVSLNIVGSLLIDAIGRARETFALLKAKAIKGLSVGFLPLRVAPREGGGSEFIEGRLVEISLCAIPAYASAGVTEIRALNELVGSLNQADDRDALLALRGQIDAALGVTAPDPQLAELAAALKTFKPYRRVWRGY